MDGHGSVFCALVGILFVVVLAVPLLVFPSSPFLDLLALLKAMRAAPCSFGD